MNVRPPRRVLLGLTTLLVLFGVWWLTVDDCVSTWFFQDVKMPRCPDGTLRQTVRLDAEGLSREAPGTVTVSADAHGVTAGDEPLQSPVRRITSALFLVDAEGHETPLPGEGGWTRPEGTFSQSTRVKLPALPDGDYRLRARVTSKLGTDTVDAPLAFYAPARIHVLTDRPLYEPGHQVRFRAVVLRARDLSPLDGRPGTWFVTDPEGEVLLEKKLPAGPWGVVSGDFPLDRGASTGTWRVSWKSGDASGETTFEVKPFTLPRFQVEAHSAQPFWRAGESPRVEGQVVYASGAPVAGANVKLSWQVSGDWPPPLAWLAPATPDTPASPDALPLEARTDGAGRFRLALPRVPFDLRGQVTLLARLAATDPAGDQVAGATSVLLAEDALAVSAVTEFEGGLVDGYNNRVYLRATTAAGELLPGAELTVRRAWDPNDQGMRAVTDEDGVAVVQLDPGPPVNVVLPALPVRPKPPALSLSLTGTKDLLAAEQTTSLEDRIALERSLASLRPCARFVPHDQQEQDVELALRVTAGGAVVDMLQDDTPLADCIVTRLRARALPAGRERMLSLTLTVKDPGLPMLDFEVLDVAEMSTGISSLNEALARASLDARDCLPLTLLDHTPVPALLTWRIRSDKREVETAWVPRQEGSDEAGDEEAPALSASQLACIQSRFAGLRMKATAGAAMGVVHFAAEPKPSVDDPDSTPHDRAMLGYELKVSARRDKEDLGTTTWVVSPARLPPTRLRASPVLARAGQEVRVELLRGPDYTGGLPETMELRAGEHTLEAKVERTEAVPVARFTLPPDFDGWAETSWNGALARVYVAPRAQLTLELAPDRTAYAPGALAHLQVTTWVDGQKGPAAVGLFGVDDSLSQLVALPGPSTLDPLRPAPTLSESAFGVLDGTALAMGRIRGANAAAATMLRVTGLPSRVEQERPVTLSAQAPFEPDVELTEPFYRVLAELNTQVRAWEQSAPEGETLSPAGMAKQWSQAISACEQRGEPVADAYGRRLRLSRLPAELLALTDPRAVVVDGKRLPQDIENWGAWVARESP